MDITQGKLREESGLETAKWISTIYGLQIHPNPCPSYLLWATHRQ